MKISIYCPPMQIFADGPDLKKTAAEPMTATLGIGLVIPNVTIPPTRVTKQSWLKWLVDACVGETPEGAFPSLRVELPAEKCRVRGLGMYALSIVAPVHAMLDDGPWDGEVTFPDCRIKWWRNPMIASAITATGTLTKRLQACGQVLPGKQLP